MIIEHKQTKHQHNVLVKTDGGDLLAVITDRFSHSSQKDWRIFTAEDTQISEVIKPKFNDSTPLETIIQLTQDRIEGILSHPHGTYIVKLKTHYGLTLYYAEDSQSGGYPMAGTRISGAMALNFDKAKLITKGIRDGYISINSGYHDDFIIDAVLCSLDATPINENA
ncbi:hypothetical protein OTK49_02510 [Vibrio coralliirubri]|uniref:hypothetical protein n=1 Tax=Vibrio coralliirubri TaxID=1516159 RepID=UPI0022840512|nr:hypothetical protein [Vibrio coralliirubri]MCY9861389.1 hypothetical protein [Vibrio coralliirubri]